jgi:hypothetical protein
MELHHRWREDIGHVDQVHAVRRRTANILLGLAMACAVLLIVLVTTFGGGLRFLVFDISGDESKVVAFLKIVFFLGTIMFLIFGYVQMSLSRAFTVWVDMPVTGDKDDQWVLLQSAVEGMFKKEDIAFKKLVQRNPNFVGYFKLPEGLSVLLTRSGTEFGHEDEPVHSFAVALRNINPGNKERAREVQRLLDAMPYLEILERKVVQEVLDDPGYSTL